MNDQRLRMRYVVRGDRSEVDASDVEGVEVEAEAHGLDQTALSMPRTPRNQCHMLLPIN
jgi:hypothetical protein